tara:strand:+ start:475 stop:1152 length:678 start_codon:yes stop_codon:yes gene_type:complete
MPRKNTANDKGEKIMAEVNDMFDDITKEQSIANPNAKKKQFTPIATGEYYGHIVKVETKILDVKGGKYKARLYSYTVEASEENKDKDFTYYDNYKQENVNTKGFDYVGKKFRGNLWKFLEPGKGDTFESNADGNSSFLRFCDTIGKDCPVETRNIDGQDVEVKLLPSLSSEDFLGQPVIAFVDKGRPYKDKNGKERQYMDCKFCKKWDDGKKKDISVGGENEIPF